MRSNMVVLGFLAKANVECGEAEKAECHGHKK
jgi:hypothetical protein